jgi:hypothetical protein
VNVPTVMMPAPLLSAVEAVEEREQELRAAEQAVAAAREGVKVGHRQDIEAIAAARENGKADPKPHFEREALDVLAAAEHEAEIAQARLSQVRVEADRLSEELRPSWRSEVESAWRKLDTQQRRRVKELGAGVERTQELRSCWAYLHAIDVNPADSERTLRKAMAPASRVGVDLSAVLEAIEASSADTVIAAAAAAEAQRQAHSEAVNAATAAAIEQARREREAADERVQRRREALSEAATHRRGDSGTSCSPSPTWKASPSMSRRGSGCDLAAMLTNADHARERRQPRKRKALSPGLFFMELAGLEPATSWVRSRRSPS